jgi:DNA-binding NarL/FixJ family response regulator
MIKIAITDDHPIVIDGLFNALNKEPDFNIIGCYSSGTALFQGLKQEVPDVLLLDLQLPDRNGRELVPVLLDEYPCLHILIVSSSDSSPYIKEMMRKGCKGYLSKSTTTQSLLVTAIKQVYAGEVFLDAGLKAQLLDGLLATASKPRRANRKPNPTITSREKEVLQLICKEYNNQEIGEQLFVSTRTIETHRYNLLQKLGAKNTLGLVRIAEEYGLLE